MINNILKSDNQCRTPNYIWLIIYGVLTLLLRWLIILLGLLCVSKAGLRYRYSMTFMPQVYPIICFTGATLLSRNRMHFSKAVRSYGNRLLWGHRGCLSSAEPIYHDAVTPGERCSAGDSYAETGVPHTHIDVCILMYRDILHLLYEQRCTHSSK